MADGRCAMGCSSGIVGWRKEGAVSRPRGSSRVSANGVCCVGRLCQRARMAVDGRLGRGARLAQPGLALFTCLASVSQLPLLPAVPREQTACSPSHRGAICTEPCPDFPAQPHFAAVDPAMAIQPAAIASVERRGGPASAQSAAPPYLHTSHVASRTAAPRQSSGSGNPPTPLRGA